MILVCRLLPGWFLGPFPNTPVLGDNRIIRENVSEWFFACLFGSILRHNCLMGPSRIQGFHVRLQLLSLGILSLVRSHIFRPVWCSPPLETLVLVWRFDFDIVQRPVL